MSTDLIDTPEALYSLRVLHRQGYGSREKLRRLIAEGTLPAVRVHNRLMIRASDLHLIAQPVGSPDGASP